LDGSERGDVESASQIAGITMSQLTNTVEFDNTDGYGAIADDN
jgi:hypothetical protein